MPAKPIRVLKLIAGFALESHLGGIERFGMELVQALDQTQVEPILCGMWAFGTEGERQWVERLQQQGVEAFMGPLKEDANPYRNFWQMYQQVAAYLEGRQVDIIHSHSGFGDVLALLLARQLGAQMVVRTVHNEREWPKRPFRRLLLTNLLYPFAFAAEMGVAQRVVDNLNGRLLAQLTRKKAILSYNALNFNRFTHSTVDNAAKKQSLGLPANATVVGSIGRLTEQKGYPLFIEAAASVLQHRPDTYFLLVGNGHLAAVLQAQAQAAGLAHRFLFTGARTDVDELLPILDLFVNSSLWEGLPTVILESMAARVPVIATAVSGNTELIQHQQTGYLVPANNAADLAAGIVHMLTMPYEQRLTMTEAAYAHIRATFSIETIARQHELLYQKLLHK